MVSFAACLDELRKIAAAKAQMRVPQSREGRRSMSVDTMLRRDAEGTLFKGGQVQPAGTNDALHTPEALPGRPAVSKRRPGDVPSLDEVSLSPKAESVQSNRSLVGS